MSEHATEALPSPCRLVGCWALVEQTPGAGRPRLYCCDEHRREADTMRKRVESRLGMLREQVRRDEHLLAALVEQTRGAGRPRLYCCDEHRREADTMRKRVESRLGMLREQVRRDEHLLAAMSEPEVSAP